MKIKIRIRQIIQVHCIRILCYHFSNKIGQQKSNRYYSIATLLLLRNYSFFQKICKYCLNAFVNFFLQKTLQIDTFKKHYKLIIDFLKIIVLKFLSKLDLVRPSCLAASFFFSQSVIISSMLFYHLLSIE